MSKKKTALIIGAGPAGLTAARELLNRTDIIPVVLEQSEMVGGISRTVNYKGNRLDIGGHRFFSKSDRVMDWWLKILPIQKTEDQASGIVITYQNSRRQVGMTGEGPNPDETDAVMLVRNRLSRIFYNKKFYDYPVRLNLNTIRNLGLKKIIRIGLTYARARLLPVKPESSLEDFFINRFGKELYQTFFMDYTEKVWGVPCRSIKPEWGSQRVKGLSVSKALWHSVTSVFLKNRSIHQKETETSLIDRFLYPKYGPGHLWQTVEELVRDQGGQILFKKEVIGLDWEKGRITGVKIRNPESGQTGLMEADYVFSTMPVRDLIAGMGRSVPADIQRVAEGLKYRDFITVGLLFRKMTIKGGLRDGADYVPDNWIYIQESYVKVGRIQVFNNWSPYLVKDLNTVWLGLEYFCQEGDELWSLANPELINLGITELEKVGFCSKADYLDGTVVRVPKTYPAYFGTYDQFDLIRDFTDSFDNLFLIGRNGMHK